MLKPCLFHLLAVGIEVREAEGSWPVTRQQQIDSFRGMPEDAIEAIIGGNAVDFDGLDVAKLAPIAARIGPAKGTFQETSA